MGIHLNTLSLGLDFRSYLYSTRCPKESPLGMVINSYDNRLNKPDNGTVFDKALTLRPLSLCSSVIGTISDTKEHLRSPAAD